MPASACCPAGMQILVSCLALLHLLAPSLSYCPPVMSHPRQVIPAGGVPFTTAFPSGYSLHNPPASSHPSVPSSAAPSPACLRRCTRSPPSYHAPPPKCHPQETASPGGDSCVIQKAPLSTTAYHPACTSHYPPASAHPSAPLSAADLRYTPRPSLSGFRRWSFPPRPGPPQMT